MIDDKSILDEIEFIDKFIEYGYFRIENLDDDNEIQNILNQIYFQIQKKKQLKKELGGE